MKGLFFLLFFVSFFSKLFAISEFAVYRNGWIDFNKNGKKDKYENPNLNIEIRLTDLIAQMTLEEKVGQLLTPQGWTMYDRIGDSIVITDKFKEDVKKRHIGSLWAFMRADPWTQKTLANGLTPILSVSAVNKMQRYVIENTRLGIPVILSEEAPHGHMAIGGTVYPTSIGLSSTWNPDLVEQVAETVGKEIRCRGGHIAYGPVLDLLWEPRWSRSEECFGEDPLLTSRFAVAYVKGLQGDNLKYAGVASTLKHFTAYGIPEGGHNSGAAHIGDWELNTYIYPAFKAGVDAGVKSVMASYNIIDGKPCTSNKELLTETLKNKWKFNGFVVSDLGGIEMLVSHGVAKDMKHAAIKAFNAGVDSDLGANSFSGNLINSVYNGLISEQDIDEAVGRILRLKFEMGLFDDPFVQTSESKFKTMLKEHKKLSYKVAQESIILLKNDDNLLPLDKNVKSIAVIGPNADNIYNMLGDYTAPQLDNDVITVLDGIRNKVGNKTKVYYSKGCSIRGDSDEYFAEALSIASKSDINILVMGGSSARDFSTNYEFTGAAKITDDIKTDMDCGEGSDRSTLSLLGRQQELMEKVVALGKPTILILIKGRPMTINWADKNVPAIIDAWYPGMEGGSAIADVLFGDYNPAGRLSVSIPKHEGQLPVNYNTARANNRKNYIDNDGMPLYTFGYGLSYTSFEYDNMSIYKDNDMIVVSVNLKNTGNYNGDEVVQLYVRQHVSDYSLPDKRLIDFRRIHVTKGTSKEVVFKIPIDVLKTYQGNDLWKFENGKYTFMIASSSDNIKLSEDINL